ncbi:MAG TPA: ATP-binding protein [Chryseolinea sp.]|nr:ATP-binding protein [Chryseolinea sp.]
MNRNYDHAKNTKNEMPTFMSVGSLIVFFTLFLMVTPLWAQNNQLVQIKTFDQQLQPYKNVQMSINGKDYFTVGNKGVAFVELEESDLPLKSIKMKDELLEAASWNYTKGIVEVIIRKKSYQLIEVVVKDQNNAPLQNLKVTFNGKKTLTSSTNREGLFEIPLALDEKVTSTNQFTIKDYKIVKLQLIDGKQVLTADRLKAVKEGPATATRGAENGAYFKDFDLSKLDSIQSLTVFYAIFKNYQLKDMSDEAKRRIDAKFTQLVQQLQDSLQRSDNAFIGKISDSSFVSDDITNLLEQSTMESQMLEGQRADFEKKVEIIHQKLSTGIQNLNAEARAKVLSDLSLLEGMLMQNENKFYKNQTDYRDIINSLKQNFFDVEALESRLSASEMQRLEEQRAFRQKIFATLAVLFGFSILILLLLYFGDKLKKQKKELVRVNEEIRQMNENLEGIVAERTKLLAEANKELDTFLYRASHDLRSPVCSIIGLCNIALMLSNGESKDLVEKMVTTTATMDKLLKKLSIISEINQPTNFSSITLLDVIENIRTGFSMMIKDQRIKFTIDCPADLVIYSYPNLIETILVNLIENAFFYSVMRDSKNAQVQLTAAVKEDQLEISLYDNGIGVDDSISPKLFDMFFKGNENSKGHGLGLYIVQKSVQALEGKITVESEPDRYTKFIVSLPLKQMTFNPKSVQTSSKTLELVN